MLARDALRHIALLTDHAVRDSMPDEPQEVRARIANEMAVDLCDALGWDLRDLCREADIPLSRLAFSTPRP